MSGSEGAEILSTNYGTLSNDLITFTTSDFSDGSFDPEEDLILELEEVLQNCGSNSKSYEAWWSRDGIEV